MLGLPTRSICSAPVSEANPKFTSVVKSLATVERLRPVRLQISERVIARCSWIKPRTNDRLDCPEDRVSNIGVALGVIFSA